MSESLEQSSDHSSGDVPGIESPSFPTPVTPDAQPLFQIPAKTGRTGISIRDPSTGEIVSFKHNRVASSETTFNYWTGPSDDEEKLAMNATIQHSTSTSDGNDIADELYDYDEVNLVREPLRAVGRIKARQLSGIINTDDAHCGIMIMRNTADELERRKIKLEDEVADLGRNITKLRDEALVIERRVTELDSGQTSAEEEDSAFENNVARLTTAFHKRIRGLEDTHIKKREEIQANNMMLKGYLEGELMDSLDAMVVNCGHRLRQATPDSR